MRGLVVDYLVGHKSDCTYTQPLARKFRPGRGPDTEDPGPVVHPWRIQGPYSGSRLLGFHTGPGTRIAVTFPGPVRNLITASDRS